ncbi:hypothetical protein KSP39_PZI013192 [Platanthera zijinensis]|uniref:Uncharacterized protein n=1 Tax=Platanthera zijinensis TaxID=2320716 RepID=A0AAP0BCF0_9ASPA
METKTMLVFGFTGFLGLISAVLAFAAEATRIRSSDVVTSMGHCIYPKSSALYLGLLSVISLVMAQAVINIFAGCICCKRISNSSNANWTVALIAFIGSWISFVIASIMLMAGATLNDQKTMQKMYSGNYCYVVKVGVFSGGALLALSSVSLGLIYCAALKKSQSPQPLDYRHSRSIALGQPQNSPPIVDPVFLHEDTYKRLQIP